MKFSDLVPSNGTLDGSKMKMEEILGKDILVTSFTIKDSKIRDNEEYATIQFKLADDPEEHIVFTGSKVLMEQLNAAKQSLDEMGQKFEFEGKIVQKGSYFCFE